MEGLLNYSSEDEQDEPAYQRKADGPTNRGERDGNSRSHGRSSGSGGSYKDEAYDRHSGSSHQRDGARRDDRHSGNNYSRDNKDSREVRGRDSRDFNNGNKRHHDNRDNRSSHDRNYQRYGRDDYNRRERPRNDERYNNRHAATTSSSSHNTSRPRSSAGNGTGNNNYDNSRSRYGHNQTAISRRDDERSERYSSTSNRYDNSRQPQSSNKYSSRGRRSRSRSRSKERRSPVATKPVYETGISPEREFHAEKSNQIDHPTRGIAPLMSLPLSSTAPRQPNMPVASHAVSAASTEASSAIPLPSYYNPSVINPTKYAEQVQKRKLLWGAKKTEDTSAKWENAHFSQDTDGKVASKFMRLMGIKNAAAAASGSEEQEKIAPDVRSREAMFSSMEQQYEVARQVTHTMRGVGLGFGSSRPY